MGGGVREEDRGCGYGFGAFGNRYTATPELRYGRSGSVEERGLGWRLTESRRGGLAFGMDLAGVRREGSDGGHEDRIVLGFGWRMEGSKWSLGFLEFRTETSWRRDSGDGESGGALGLRLEARW